MGKVPQQNFLCHIDSFCNGEDGVVCIGFDSSTIPELCMQVHSKVCHAGSNSRFVFHQQANHTYRKDLEFSYLHWQSFALELYPFKVFLQRERPLLFMDGLLTQLFVLHYFVQVGTAYQNLNFARSFRPWRVLSQFLCKVQASSHQIPFVIFSVQEEIFHLQYRSHSDRRERHRGSKTQT